MKVDPIQKFSAYFRRLAREKGVYNDELEKLISECNLQTRRECGNQVHHIQKVPSVRYIVLSEWEEIYEIQYKNENKTKESIAQEIYENNSYLEYNITVQQVQRLLTEKELEKSRKKIEFNNGVINDDNLYNGFVVIREGMIQDGFSFECEEDEAFEECKEIIEDIEGIDEVTETKK